MDQPRVSPTQLLQQAQQGSRSAMDALVEQYRNYLYLLAHSQLDRTLQRRVSPSDIVQETVIRAWQRLGQFRGATEGELIGWLRTILMRRIQTAVERELLAEKRDIRREVSLHERLARLSDSVERIDQALLSQLPSPSAVVRQQEAVLAVANHLARLSAHAREVIVRRSLQGAPFEQIAQDMGKSCGAVRAMWVHALARLQTLSQADGMVPGVATRGRVCPPANFLDPFGVGSPRGVALMLRG